MILVEHRERCLEGVAGVGHSDEAQGALGETTGEPGSSLGSTMTAAEPTAPRAMRTMPSTSSWALVDPPNMRIIP